MTDKLNGIYGRLWPDPSETERYVLEKQEACAHLEQKLLEAAESLPKETRDLITSYIYAREELELCSVVQAYKAGQKTGSRESGIS